MRRTFRSAVAGSMLVALFAGCSSTESAPSVPTVRQDAAPIQKRVTNIGDRFSVRWVGGITGDERVPGPSATWLDAVITLNDAGVTGRLRDAAGVNPVASRPEISAELGDPGTGLTSAGLDAFVAVEPGTVRAHLDSDRGVLVVKYFRG